MKKSTLIVQVTDCHLPADPGQLYRGINPHQNLRIMLQRVKALKPDLLLASGDLSEDGSRASYETIARLFNTLDVPVLALPGNHDDAPLLAEMFPGSPVDGVAVTNHGPWQVIRLNSCLPGKPEGRFGKNTLAQLESVLEDGQQRPRLIAVHHHPLMIGSPWIDKYRLFEPEAFLRLLDQSTNVKAVAWGHVHQVFEGVRKGVAMLGGPSCAINSLAGAKKFTADPSGPACRWIELGCDGTFRTGILR